MISISGCSIIFISLIWISLGSNFPWSFLESFWARSFVDWGSSLRCSFGMIRECPLLKGLISRMAMLFSSSAILWDGVWFATIEQKMHCPPRWVSLFCSMKDSTCSVVMELIWFAICFCLSFGKLSNCFRRCSLILFASSFVIGMVK